MRILANENLFEPIIEYLRAKGHDVISGRSPELSGTSDDEVYLKAVKEGRVIVTMDKDFIRMRRFPPHACGGIIVVKIYRRPVDLTTDMFRDYFEKMGEATIKGNLVIMTPEGVRLRVSSPSTKS